MGERIRAFEWGATPLGPPESWSPALRLMVHFLLANRFPQLLWWGPHYIQLYNDPYRPVPGTKHPKALGQPASECWPEIWHVIGPLVDTPFHGGPATWNEDIFLEVNRHGFAEETHFTIAYSSVPDDTVPGGIGGVLATVHEITEKVVAERRIVALRDLGARVGDAKTDEEACRIAADTLRAHDKDVPFVLLYLVEDEGRRARLAGAAGLHEDDGISPASVDLTKPDDGAWPFGEAVRSETMQLVPALAERLVTVPKGPWSDPPNEAVVVTIPSNRAHRPAGLMVAGISARLAFDAYYRDFLDLVRTQIATAIANARAYEEERNRADALAELDRAKTLFFSNISHEFRTPLTLMLGPTEDALASPERTLSGDTLETLYRNELRLLKLVNALLDFSRIEAGRMQAAPEPTDLSQLTVDLASTFRAAVERAGLQFVVSCEAASGEVFVDRRMWEQIVLNLLSNALKFTFDGSIELRLRDAGDEVVLEVRDTGIGIAPADQARVFERFNRIDGAKSRTHEGSGIGLALVRDLVRLHGGRIDVESAPTAGTTFTVTMPRRPDPALTAATRPANERGDASRAPAGFVEEALRWLPDAVDAPVMATTHGEPVTSIEAGITPGRVLVADDNADMREYVRRLLSTRWSVETVADGNAALAAIRARQPDVVLSDVMMPGLDGFGLLRALKSDPRTADVPVVLLSARAGEEARVEGLQSGADDYLVKPFSARELVARINAQMTLARHRRERTDLVARERLARREAEAANRAKDEFLAMLGHELRNPLAPIQTALHLMELRGDGATERERTVIERQVDYLTRLVDDLLDVSRIARGKIDLRRTNVEISDIIAKAIETASPLLEQRRHILDLSVPRSGLAVDGDSVRLAQVVSNLLTNAAKYTEPGGRITIVARKIGEEVVLRVRDTGIGISREMLPRVFELFTQERQDADRAAGGLGLGLTIVRSLVTLHGGAVSATSEGPGRGSEFIVRLPAATTTQGARGADQRLDAHHAASAGIRVLVVDDNEDAADLLGEALRLKGHDVRVASDGPAALRLCADSYPQVALVDIGLPLMDGYELADRLRNMPGGADLRLVAVTGYGQEVDRQRSRAAGFDRHLVKPVHLETLEKMIRDLYEPTAAS